MRAASRHSNGIDAEDSASQTRAAHVGESQQSARDWEPPSNFDREQGWVYSANFSEREGNRFNKDTLKEKSSIETPLIGRGRPGCQPISTQPDTRNPGENSFGNQVMRQKEMDFVVQHKMEAVNQVTDLSIKGDDCTSSQSVSMTLTRTSEAQRKEEGKDTRSLHSEEYTREGTQNLHQSNSQFGTKEPRVTSQKLIGRGRGFLLTNSVPQIGKMLDQQRDEYVAEGNANMNQTKKGQKTDSDTDSEALSKKEREIAAQKTSGRGRGLLCTNWTLKAGSTTNAHLPKAVSPNIFSPTRSTVSPNIFSAGRDKASSEYSSVGSGATIQTATPNIPSPVRSKSPAADASRGKEALFQISVTEKNSMKNKMSSCVDRGKSLGLLCSGYPLPDVDEKRPGARCSRLAVSEEDKVMPLSVESLFDAVESTQEGAHKKPYLKARTSSEDDDLERRTREQNKTGRFQYNRASVSRQ